MTTTLTTASSVTATATPTANYRVYDQTGNGVTEDFYAESLEAAIEYGRDWIEGGEWGTSEEGVYRTLKLSACVRPLVYDEDGDLDEQATDDGEDHDCTGTYSDELPECKAGANDPEADEQGHVWVSSHTCCGGIKENPGVWAGQGSSLISKTVCRCCGMLKTEHSHGREQHDQSDSVKLDERNDTATEWLKRQHAEDEFLPDWLAEYLECSISTRMTEEEAREWVEENSDEDDLDQEDLEHAFAAIFGRRADDEDRAQGLWSHLNA